MFGYKAFNEDLTCRNMQYEIGKTYEIAGLPKLCESGFHFCTEIGNLLSYYDRYSRVCIIEALGDIDTQEDSNKYCTNKIKIIKELKHPFDKVTDLSFSYNNPQKPKSFDLLDDIKVGDILYRDEENNILSCISIQDNKVFLSFNEIIGYSNIYGIDEWLKNNWGREDLMPYSFWEKASNWFIPSEYEIFGSWQHGIPDEEPYKPFEYYKYRYNRRKIDKMGYYNSWWERSSYGGYTTAFCGVNIFGDAGSANAGFAVGLAPVILFEK